MLKIAPITLEHTAAIPVKLPYAILLISQGEGVLRIGNQQAELISGRTFLLRAQQEIYMVGDLMIGYLLQFQAALLDYFLFQHTWQRGKGLYDPKAPLPFTDQDMDAFYFQLCLIGNMINEMERQTSISHQYFFLFLRLINRRAEEWTTVLPENEYLLGRVMTLIEDHYKTQRGTHFYAGALAITEKRLNAVTWELKGKKFFDVVAERIIAEADLLLLGTRLPVKDIAFELGFANQSNFSTFYTRAKGLSPRELRMSL